MPPTPSTWIDRLFGLALAGALAMAALTAAAPPAQAAEPLTGSGQRASEQRALGEFQAVAVFGNMEVVLRQGSPHQAVVQADQNLMAQLETVVEAGRNGKTLVIRWKPGLRLMTRKAPRVEVTLPTLTHLASNGSSALTVLSFQVGQLASEVSGSGDLTFNELRADALSVAISGSGSLMATGQTNRLELRISGSGDAKTEGLKADDVRLSIAGSGHAAVQAHKTLDVSVAGSGDVVYSGGATVRSQVAGSGSVRQR